LKEECILTDLTDVFEALQESLDLGLENSIHPRTLFHDGKQEVRWQGHDLYPAQNFFWFLTSLASLSSS
jgi:hypothetical protein